MRHLRHLLLVFMLVLMLATPALAQSVDLDAAVNWLQNQKLDDGGFSDGFSDTSSVGPTTEVVFAATAAGIDVSTWDAPTPLDYLAGQAGSLDGTGTIAKTALAAIATGQNPRDFGGTNLIAALNERYNADTGAFEGIVTSHAYAMLALKNAGEAVPAGAVDALHNLQADDGGWSFDAQSQSDTNTTSLAIQALIAAGEPADSETIQNALSFLRDQQNDDGGFPYQNPSDFGTETDVNSTAWSIQALLAAGENLEDFDNPHDTLATFQLDSGAFQWKNDVEGPNFLATAQAVPALADVTYVDWPVVEAAQAPPAEPATMPETGAPPVPVGVLASGLGLLLAGAGLALRRRRA